MFQEYNFTILHKFMKNHVVANPLSNLPNDELTIDGEAQNEDASLFYMQLE